MGLEDRDLVKARQTAHNKALLALPNPTSIPELTGKIPSDNEQPELFSPEKGRTLAALQPRRQALITQIEDAYYANRGTLSPQFFAGLDPEDLYFFHPDSSLKDGVAPNILEAGIAFKEAMRIQATREELAESLYQTRLKEAQDADAILGIGQRYNSQPGVDFDKIPSRVEQLGGFVEGKEYRAEDLADAFALERGESIEPESAIAKIEEFFFGDPDQPGSGYEFIATGLKGIGHLFGTVGAALDVNPADSDSLDKFYATLLGKDGAEAIMGYTGHQSPETLAARQNLELMRTGAARQELKDAVSTSQFPAQVWAQWEKENPEIIEEYIDKYGVDMAMAGFFIEFQDYKDEPDLDEQLDDFLEFGVFRPVEAMIDAQEETNFMMSNGVMELIGSWGRITDGIGANVVAGITGLVQDEDKREMVRELRFEEFLEEQAGVVEQGGHTPSGVLGLEGTVFGLLIDFGVGAVVDPTTWLLGPVGRFGVSGITSGVKAAGVMSSPAVRIGIRALPKVLAERTSAAGARLLGAFAEVGLAGEMLTATGLGDNVLQGTTWLGAKRGATADYVPINFLDNMLDDVQREAMDNIDFGRVSRRAEELLEADSLNQPLTVLYDPKARTMALAAEGDELLDLAAVRFLASEKVPITVKVRTQTLAEKTAASDPRPAILEAKRQEWGLEPDEPVIFHGTSSDDGASILAFGLEQGGLTRDIKRIAEEGWAKPGTDDVVLVFRESDFGGKFGPRDPEMVRTADNYAQATPDELYEQGSGFEQIPAGVRPVGILYGRDLEDLTRTTAVKKGPVGVPIENVAAKDPDMFAPHKYDDGSEYFHPRQLWDDEQLGIKADLKAVEQIVHETLLRGGDLPFARQTWMAVGLGEAWRVLAKTKFGERAAHFLRTTHNVDYIPTETVNGTRRAMEMVEFLGSSDPLWTRTWQRRVLEHVKARGQHNKNMAVPTKRLKKLRELEQILIDKELASIDPKAYGDLVEPGILKNVKNSIELRQVVRDMIRTDEADLAQRSQAATNAGTWQGLVDEMLNDFNRRFIATNKEWAGFVDESGMVPWEHIHRGLDPTEIGSPGRVTGRQGRQARLSLEKAAQDSLELHTRMGAKYDTESTLAAFTGNGDLRGVYLPASPMELAAATVRGGAKYTQWSQEAALASLRSGAVLVDQLWKANVLMSPRTFMVMSIDELTSMLHLNGTDFVRRYLAARASKAHARLNSVLEGKTLFNAKAGTRRLKPKAAERLRRLQDLPEEAKSFDAVLAEHMNRETIKMKPGDVGYEKAAALHEQNYLQNPAFRAYLRGREAFNEWFHSQAGQEWSLGVEVRLWNDKDEMIVRPLNSADEAYSLAHGIYKHRIEKIALENGLKSTDDFRRAWTETAAKIDADSSGRVVTMPSWTRQHYGIIEGNQPVYPGSSMAWHTLSRAYEAGAANPAAFRQGLLADMMRDAERGRIRSLLESQGKVVMDDVAVLEWLKDNGFDISEINQFNSPWIDQEMLKHGLFTEGYIGRLAEGRAQDFVNDMTYSFEQGSRVGSQGKYVFPFGRAWGDMFGRWGRMLGSRAVARPWLRKLGLEKAVQKVSDLSPVNLKTAGFLSRLSNRSLEITGGIRGDDNTDLDFSPLTFLPTESGGLTTLIPGLGIFPTMGIDFIIDRLVDPVEDPQGYQRMLDNLSQIIPGAGLHGRGPDGRFLGSGVTGLVASLASEAGRFLWQNPNRPAYGLTGNLKAEVKFTRAVSAELSDVEFMELLLEEEDPEIVDLLIMDALSESHKRSAVMNFTDVASGWLVPVRGPLDTNLDELYNVWIDAVRSNPEFFPNTQLPSDDFLRGDQELLLRTGDDIRRNFFNLEPWQRDLLVAANPTLAVNLVGSWTWSESAPADLPGREFAYSTTNSATDDPSLSARLDRHNVYVQHGWVIPRDASTRPAEILGTAVEARLNSTEQLYEFTATTMNDVIWENFVSEDSIHTLNAALTDPYLERLGITDPRELWERWATERERIEDNFLIDAGYQPNTEEGDEALDRLREKLKIPENEQAWSTTWRGDNIDAFSKRTRENPVFLDEEAVTIARTLGLDVQEGMSGETFLSTLMDYRTEQRGGAWESARYAFTEYKDDRSRAFIVAQSSLNDVKNNTRLSTDYRLAVGDFLTWVELEASDENPTRAIQQEAVDRFDALRTAGRDAPINWEEVWHLGFQGRFGPLEWEPPEPPPVYMEDGSVNPEAWSPHIRYVSDGDTLIVSEHRGPALVDVPFPRLSFNNDGPKWGVGNFRVGELEGEARMTQVRLLGVMAQDFYADADGAQSDKQRLEDALMDARRNGDRIWLVRDPDYAGSRTDPFGRELAWLYIGDEPFYFPDELRRTD